MMDIAMAIKWITDCCMSTLDWFSQIMGSIQGAKSFYLVMVTMFISTGLLLIPLRGSGMSDRAKKGSKKSDKGDAE